MRSFGKVLFVAALFFTPAITYPGGIVLGPLYLPCDCPLRPIAKQGDDYVYLSAHYQTFCNEIPSASYVIGHHDWPKNCDDCPSPSHSPSPSSIIQTGDKKTPLVPSVDKGISEDKKRFEGLDEKVPHTYKIPDLDGSGVMDDAMNRKSELVSEQFITVEHPKTHVIHNGKLFTYTITMPETETAKAHKAFVHVAYEIEYIPEKDEYGVPVARYPVMKNATLLNGDLALSIEDGSRTRILMLLAKPK